MSLQQSLRSRARFGPRPYLQPLEIALNEQPRVAIALVSEEDSRLLTVLLGAEESEQALHNHVPGRQRQGGWSAFRYERDRAHHIEEHFKTLVDKIRELDASLPARWLVIGGTNDATSAVAKLLPRSLRAKLAGTFREEQFEGSREVIARALAVAAAADRRVNLELAESIRDRALAGGPAALGWDETLQTLAEGRVHQLVIAAACLDSEKADRALDLAWQTDAAIEVLRGEAEAVLAASDGVGALLRF
jgi:peptide subunit release factor 1 (eRF1)